ncbi:CHAT domain-containing tetratricopeptide repeat protein [uncultured Aquimarina sp.]|uniref:CHAT domain-containing protein n=1 Tax=uncultured Aquimarina sp. TaxID=575652 RepID=UPI0026169268|nr:CHAT domain-containing tetratricopeptide repeat protein [uncultured Aquimarina sp.]
MNLVHKYILAFIFFCLSLTCYCQDISPQLDSIHQLTGTDYNNILLYNELLNTWEEEKNYGQLGSDAHQLAKWIHKEEYWKEAINMVERAYKAREKAVPLNSELLKRSYFNYAIYNKRKENYSLAIEFFNKILIIDGTKFLKGRAAFLIGDCYKKIGDLFKSIEYQEISFSYYDPGKHFKYLINSHIGISHTYQMIRDRESAKSGVLHLLQADSLLKLKEKPNLSSLYAIQTNLGKFYYEGVGTKNIDKAIINYNNALTFAMKINNSLDISNTYYNLAIINIKKDPELSELYFKGSLKHSVKNSPIIPLVHFGLGIKSNTEKRYLEAQEHFKDAFSAYFDQETPNIYWLPNKEKLEKIQAKSEFLELLKRKLYSWNQLAKQENNPSFYKEAIKTTMVSDQLIDLIIKEDFSFRSKLFWRDLASEIYVMGLKACLELKKVDEAFYFMEKNKALLLTQEITKKSQSIPEDILEKKTKLENKIKKLRDSLDSQKDSLSTIFIDQQNNLQASKDSLSTLNLNYFSNINITEILPLSQINLEDDEVVLQYIMAERVADVVPEAYGMIISSTKKEIFELHQVDSILNNIINLRKQLHKPFKTSEDILRYKETAHQLYSSIIPKEIQPALKNNKITIVPDHMISFIPFDALVTDIKTGSYLIEDSEINYTYSLSFLKENELLSRNAKHDFLGIAPINFSNDLKTLKNSAKEITNANHYYNGDLFIEENATKERFLREANKYRILHLATHADASDSIAPWIAFRDSKLTDLELNTLKNQAELVVLSACNTSLGEVRRGEGVLSLARGFFKSGANTVIPSLWSTNDKTTAKITSDFYKNLSEGQTKSAALRNAKLNYLRNNTDAEASPHYWASLVLIGDSGTLLPSTNYWMFLWIGLGLILILIIPYGLFLRKKKQ